MSKKQIFAYELGPLINEQQRHDTLSIGTAEVMMGFFGPLESIGREGLQFTTHRFRVFIKNNGFYFSTLTISNDKHSLETHNPR
jgi:hypothetical protein